MVEQTAQCDGGRRWATAMTGKEQGTAAPALDQVLAPKGHHIHTRKGRLTMPWVTRGTVQFTASQQIGATSATDTITINPICDYSVKHNDITYGVIIENPLPVPAVPAVPPRIETYVPKVSRFVVQADLRAILIQAAFNGTRLQVTIDDTKRDTITGITIPAAP